jgi:formylglycine-generating enzyme required for sulfatase activity
MAGKIFISYRRSETSWAARALFERLWREFGDRVFIDIEGLTLGTDYTTVIDAHLDGCEVMLALIGATWLDEIRRREADADDEDAEPDWVRAELARALARDIPVVPVLIEDAKLPLKKELPAELKALRNRHGLELHARLFDAQVGPLVREIRKVVGVAEAPLPASPFRGEEEDSVGRASAVEAPAKALPPAGGGLGGGPTILHHPSWMHDQGTDPLGRWCEFKVGNVVQRMRWIEPGTFWMGSPDDEPGRGSNETRHCVTLTRGYWMADTACTQALWQEVMGSNPSRFTADLQNPVEQVSWNDVTGLFLPELRDRVPGLNLQLPTEAQWEYACRAGTETPFSFGRQITIDQVNYDGNYPFNGGNKGLYRKKTVPVKALPANAKGLYQMHGNVMEWCADGAGDYPKVDAKDPFFPPDRSTQRVLRGGGWVSGGRSCRCAFRNTNSSDERSFFIGFRLVRGLADQ